jgi:hypothetical protein
LDLVNYQTHVPLGSTQDWNQVYQV